jgi:AraC-like DNA-binding protein
MDVRLIDSEGVIVYEHVSHTIPVVLPQADQEAVHILETLHAHAPGYYDHYQNPHGLEYLAGGVWLKEVFGGCILVGPLISSLSVVELVRETIVSQQLPVAERKMLEQFYESLPIVSDTELQHMGQLLGHLCIHHEIQAQQIPSPGRFQYPKQSFHAMTSEEHRQVIEQRYEHQNLLMDAISTGNQEQARIHVDYLIAALVEFSDRVPGSPLRASKNIGFVLNTICRLAAERSGVHPVYLHHISERFAIQIERTSSLPELKKLFRTLVAEYGELVQTASTGSYSPIVKKAIDYILLNLGSALQLEKIAEQIHVNPSHLSRRFKQETGMTLTDFINHRRIEEAKLYLQRGHATVTEVAFLVGFNDLNYFGKVFKKFTSMSPTQYARRRT